MEWKDLGAIVGKAAPLLGTLIGGPAGALVGSLIADGLGVANDPTAVNTALVTDPDAQVKIAQIAADNKVQLQQLSVTAEQNRLQADTASIVAVNATMQAEAENAANENWFQKGWRPLCGYVVAIASGVGIMAVFLLAWRALGLKDPNALAAIPNIVVSVTSLLAVPGAAVGITAWHRGQLQREQVKGAQAAAAD